MSELVQGLLIAVPAVISAVSSAWVAVHASRAGARKAEVAITAEHAQWLRGKRSDVYDRMNRLLRAQRFDRTGRIKAGPVSVGDMRSGIAKIDESLRSPEANDLSADGTTYNSLELAQAFDAALVANLEAWKVFLMDIVDEQGDTGLGVLTERVEKAMKAANDAERKVFGMIRDDVTWTDSPEHRRQIRGRVALP